MFSIFKPQPVQEFFTQPDSAGRGTLDTGARYALDANDPSGRVIAGPNLSPVELPTQSREFLQGIIIGDNRASIPVPPVRPPGWSDTLVGQADLDWWGYERSPQPWQEPIYATVITEEDDPLYHGQIYVEGL